MTTAKQWLCFIFEDRGRGRLSKPPISPKTKKKVDKTDETQWVSFQRAYGAYERGDNVEGIGFVFDNGFIAIDLDDCFDERGTLFEVAQDVLDHFHGAYVEYSPSGNGLHIFLRGKKPNTRTKDSTVGIEVYDNKNFVTVTGDITPDSGVEVIEMQAELDWLFEKYLPEQNIKGVDYSSITPEHGDKTPAEWLAIGLEKDARLADLYNNDDHTGDESNVDMSFLNKLSFWLNRDYEVIEDAFLNSPWFDTKDATHKAKCISRHDYLHKSIVNAINRVTETACERDDKFQNRVKIKVRSSEPGGDASSLVDDRFLNDLTDAGVARLMADVYSDTLCYTDELGWCWYNGRFWETNNKTAAMRCTAEITDMLLKEAQEWLDEVVAELFEDDVDPKSDEWKKATAEPTRLIRYVKSARKASTLRSIMDITATKMYALVDVFDSHPWLLNTPLCVIDLRTGERMAHNPKHMITSITSVTPEVRTSDLWIKTLNDTFCNDEQLIEYCQLHVGSALVGKVFEEGIVIANGGGSNGKSTLFGAVQTVLGDYATSINPELLLTSRASDQQVGAAMLYGKRLAIAQETNEGSRLNGAMLKRLVSTDTMVAKKLYCNPFTFVPTHTLILSTNHLPVVSSNDNATWRRIDVLPFNAEIKDDKKITDYSGMLVNECGGEILQWCVEGAMKFYEAGCSIKIKPEAALRAKKEYRENEDWLLRFVSDCVLDKPAGKLTHESLYDAFGAWCRSEGLKERSSIALSKALKNAEWKGEDKAWCPEIGKVAKVWYDKALNPDRRRNMSARIVKVRTA